MKRLLILFVWFPTTLLTIGVSLFFYFYYSFNLLAQEKLKQIAEKPRYYQMYMSVPKTLGISTVNIQTDDAIPELIAQYLQKYHSPMAQSAYGFAETFRAYGVDPIIPLAIAQCESNLGMKTPENCYNPFGLGIHSAGTLCFQNWEEGYEKMAKVLKSKYLDQGLTSPEEIMEKYCPLSVEKGGSWAKCVTQFMEEIQTLTIRRK